MKIHNILYNNLSKYSVEKSKKKKIHSRLTSFMVDRIGTASIECTIF